MQALVEDLEHAYQLHRDEAAERNRYVSIHRSIAKAKAKAPPPGVEPAVPAKAKAKPPPRP